MAALSRNRVGEFVLSTSCCGLVVAGMAVIDEEVRLQVAGVLTSRSSDVLESARIQLQGLTSAWLETAWSTGAEYSVLTALVIASAILVTAMLRS